MSTPVFMIPTMVGEAKIAAMLAGGDPLTITEIAVGDANGAPYTPVRTMTVLVNEVFRAGVLSLSVDPDNPSLLAIEMVIPPEEGGWTMNEIGVFDADGDMVGIGSIPSIPKPILGEGSVLDLIVRPLLLVTSAASVVLSVDPLIVTASRKYVDDQIAALKDESRLWAAFNGR